MLARRIIIRSTGSTAVMLAIRMEPVFMFVVDAVPNFMVQRVDQHARHVAAA